MLDEAPILPWLDHLKELLPPEGVVVVGAGVGTGPWVDWLKRQELRDVVLVEADEAKLRQLEEAVGDRETWRVTGQVVGGETGSAVFYHASHGAESGLIDPESLRSVWSNIKTRRSEAKRAITLEDLLKEGTTANWLLVNCLPARPILEGAGRILERVDVIVARVLLDDGVLPGSGNREDLTRYLEPFSFRCVAVESERHPALARALYVRDLQEVARKLRGEARRLKQRVEEARKAVEELGVESRRQIAELEAQVGTIRAEKAFEAEGLRLALGKATSELASFTTAKQDAERAKKEIQDELREVKRKLEDWKRARKEELQEAARVLSRTQAKVEELVARLREREAELLRANERAEELEHRTAELTGERDGLAEVAAQHDKQMEHILSVLAQNAEAIAQLQEALEASRSERHSETRLSDTQQCSRWLQDEMDKAEAQVRLLQNLIVNDCVP